MKAKEKAKELVEKFSSYAHSDWHEVYGFDENCRIQNAKQCALIAVDEILKLSYFTHEPSEDDDLYSNYWKQVKQEIEKL